MSCVLSQTWTVQLLYVQALLIVKGIWKLLPGKSKGRTLGGNGQSSPYRIHRLCNWSTCSILRDWDAGIPESEQWGWNHSEKQHLQTHHSLKSTSCFGQRLRRSRQLRRGGVYHRAGNTSLPEISHCQRLGPHFGHEEDISTVDTVKKMLKDSLVLES